VAGAGYQLSYFQEELAIGLGFDQRERALQTQAVAETLIVAGAGDEWSAAFLKSIVTAANSAGLSAAEGSQFGGQVSGRRICRHGSIHRVKHCQAYALATPEV
jgi:hypothetical protein